MKKIIIITGLTGSGKSALAVKIAEKYHGEIISCDSVQVYRGLDIGSAKEDIETLKRIPHHLIDICDPKENYNVGRFVEDFKSALEICEKNHAIPIVVGGTGMYIKAILEGWTLGCEANEEFRKECEEYAKTHGNLALYERLKSVDPKLAKTVHPNNVHRVIRYLEINKFGEKQKEKSIIDDYEKLILGINIDRERIYQKIDLRVDEMLKSGLLEEVKNLMDSGLNLAHNSMNSIGYREVFQYLNHEIDFDRCVELIKQHTRNYAKRQLTFMKTIKNIKLVTIDEAEKLIDKFLKE